MDRDKRKQIALAVLIVGLILLFVVYFLWGTVIDYGRITIQAEAPFSVEVFGESKHECEVSPCELRLRGGEKTLILRKDEHESILLDVDIKKWNTTTQEVIFSINPQIASAQGLPVKETQKEFQLILDSSNGMQKLVDASDTRASSITYFREPMEDYKLFTTKDFVLIQSDEQLYKIDTLNEQKTDLSQLGLSSLESAVFSDDGRYLIISTLNVVSIIDTDKIAISDLDLNLESSYAWTDSSWLIFATNQGYSLSGSAGQYGENYINILSSQVDLGATFGIYHPDEDSYTLIEQFTNVAGVPEELIPLANGRAVYFQSGEEFFKIILEQL